MNLKFNLPFEAFRRFWNSLWIFFHQVLSKTEHASLQELRPFDIIHIEIENFFVLFVEFIPKILKFEQFVNIYFKVLYEFKLFKKLLC